MYLALNLYLPDFGKRERQAGIVKLPVPEQLNHNIYGWVLRKACLVDG
jgi:hypothetical protein